MTSRADPSHPALILAAHGAGEHSAANRAVLRLVDQLLESGTFSEVRAAFRLGSPGFAEVLDGLAATHVTVVPIMTSNGHFTQRVLPGELARNPSFGERIIHQAAPLGQHPQLPKVIAARLSRLLKQHCIPPEAAAIGVVGHGTPRHPQSRDSAQRLAEALAATIPGVQTHALFIDDEPPISAIFELTQRPTLLIVPFMFGGGEHALKDLPQALGLAAGTAPGILEGRANDRRILCDQPLRQYGELLDLIKDLAAPPAARNAQRTWRIGTRASRLALRQADIVAQALREKGQTVEIITLSTTGDRDMQPSIADLPGAAPFADDVERALLEGTIDIAVHSLKDLPDRPTPGLTLAAILEREDAGEALIAREHKSLEQLPARALVGTSSPRRAAQILARRPDVQVAPIRGPIDARIDQLQDGSFDAIVLAMAGLRRLGLASAVTETLALSDFLPAPGQGALAVQVRTTDGPAQRCCSALDHRPTRMSTATELAFQRLASTTDAVATAAHATYNGKLCLRARLTALDGSRVRDVVVRGTDPREVANEAYARAAREPLPIVSAAPLAAEAPDKSDTQ